MLTAVRSSPPLLSLCQESSALLCRARVSNTHTHTRFYHVYEYASLQQHIMNSHDRTCYKPMAAAVCAQCFCAVRSHTHFSHIRGRVDSALLSGLFHVLCLDDTSDIQPVVLLARQSISSQSGGGPFG